MSYLPNPGTFHSAFRTRAEAAAATILADIEAIFIGESCLVLDATGTAFTSRDGRKWSPFSVARLIDWGVTGTALAPGAAGQLNEPATAEQAGIEAALLWCGQNARELYGDTSRVYGVTGPLYVGGATGSRTWGLHDLNLYVKSWSATVTPRSGYDPDAWAQDAAVLTIGGSAPNHLRFFRMSNVHIDCARLAGTGVRYLHVSQANVDDVTVDRARTFGHDIGRPANGEVTTVSCTASRFTRLRSREFWYSADPSDGYTDWTVRTSCGIRVSGSDCSVAESEFSTAAVCGVLAQGFNVAFDNCIWWGNPDSPSAPDYDSRNVFIVSKSACNYRFNNCSYQDGRFILHGAAVDVGGGFTPAFQGQIIGCTFSQYSGNQIVIYAHEVGETASSLIFVGNRVRSLSNAVLWNWGDGTWGDFSGEWAGNTRINGASFAVQDKSLIQGFFAVYTDGRVRAAALIPTVATPGQSAMWCVGGDGKLYTHNGTSWFAHEGVVVT